MQPHFQRETVMRLIFCLLLMLTQPAWAATPASWLLLDGAARKACGREITRLASKARIGGVTGRVSGIGAANDADRYYALVLNGKTAAFASQWLCLYDKRAKTAVAREIEARRSG
jgi:hypothetical protein